MSTVLILGATSTIAERTAHEFAADGTNVILAGRNEIDLKRIQADLQVRYRITAPYKLFDALAFERHEGFFREVVTEHPTLDGVLLMYGAMSDQAEAEVDFAASKEMIDVNFTSAVSILNIAANHFEERKSGFIGALSSVAGDRGRQSNYIYGSTKAGLSTYLDGMRNRLHASGVRVMTIKPGIVDTKMTYGRIEDSPLVAKPETVARDIHRSVRKKRDVLYTPWFWLLIMFVIKIIPEFIFKRTDI